MYFKIHILKVNKNIIIYRIIKKYITFVIRLG